MENNEVEIYEIEKFKKVKKYLSQDILYKRYENESQLFEYLKEEYRVVSMGEVDESGLIADYTFICSINEDWGYADIYFCRGFDGSFIITEVAVSEV